MSVLASFGYRPDLKPILVGTGAQRCWARRSAATP
jgi:hypothetical protein